MQPMNIIIGLLVQAAVILLVLPALGLITFLGGYGTAIGATIVMLIAAFIVIILLWPALLAAVFPAAIVSALTGDGEVFAFIMQTIFYSLCLWITSGMMESLILRGFWQTIGAGAILVLANKLAVRLFT